LIAFEGNALRICLKIFIDFICLFVFIVCFRRNKQMIVLKINKGYRGRINHSLTHFQEVSPTR